MTKKIVLLSLLIVCWLFVIFYFSSMDTNKSNGSSKGIIGLVVDRVIDIGKGIGIIDKDISNSKRKEIINILNYPVRKCAHASVYLVLAVLFMCALVISKKFKIKNAILITILVCFLYASGDEFHQTFVNGRTGQFSDVIIDTVGASIGCLIYSKVYRKSNKC